MSSRSIGRRWSIAAAVLIVLGGWLTVVGYRSRSFGWFAYAPLAEQTYEWTTGLLVVGREEAVGLAVLMVGLVLAAVRVGVSIGLRSGSPATAKGDRLDPTLRDGGSSTAGE